MILSRIQSFNRTHMRIESSSTSLPLHSNGTSGLTTFGGKLGPASPAKENAENSMFHMTLSRDWAARYTLPITGL